MGGILEKLSPRAQKGIIREKLRRNPSLCFKDFIYLFLQRGEEKEKEGGEKHQCERNINNMEQWPLTGPQRGTWPTTQAHALMGNQTGNLSVCRPALSPLSHTSQGRNPSLFDLQRVSLWHDPQIQWKAV